MNTFNELVSVAPMELLFYCDGATVAVLHDVNIDE
jgi:hypothetical protein